VLSLILAQPGHWLGPVTGPGWLGLAQPMWAELDPAQKIKNKNRKVKRVKKIKKYVCMNKNNVNLLVYSLTPESGIKISV
jgi:hypothetical protein